MRRIMAISWLHLKTMIRTPSAWILMVVMPLIFSAIFGGLSAGSENYKPLVLITVPKGEAESQAAKLLMDNKQYEWKKVSSSEAKEELKGQKAVAYIVIHEDPDGRLQAGRPLFDVVVQRETQEYLTLHPFIEGAAKTVADAFSISEKIDKEAFPALLKEVSGQPGIQIEKEVIQKEGKKAWESSMLSLGFTIMFMMFGISGAASTILDEKAGGTWPRLLRTPATRSQIISGYILSYFLMGWVQLGIMTASISFMFGGTWGDMVWFIPYASLVILTIVGFGLMIAGLVKTKQQAGALSAILIVSTSMLGGVYWPLDIVPDVMKLIAKFVPQSWMISGIQEIVSGSMNESAIWNAVMALILFSAVFFFFGLRKLKYDQ